MMKKMIWFVVLIFLVNIAIAADWNVPTDFSDFQTAINSGSVSVGDTIICSVDQSEGDLVINKSVTINGNNTCTVDSVFVTSANSKIYNLIIDEDYDFGTVDKDAAGIYIDTTANNLTVENLTMSAITGDIGDCTNDYGGNAYGIYALAGNSSFTNLTFGTITGGQGYDYNSGCTGGASEGGDAYLLNFYGYNNINFYNITFDSVISGDGGNAYASYNQAEDGGRGGYAYLLHGGSNINVDGISQTGDNAVVSGDSGNGYEAYPSGGGCGYQGDVRPAHGLVYSGTMKNVNIHGIIGGTFGTNECDDDANSGEDGPDMYIVWGTFSELENILIHTVEGIDGGQGDASGSGNYDNGGDGSWTRVRIYLETAGTVENVTFHNMTSGAGGNGDYGSGTGGGYGGDGNAMDLLVSGGATNTINNLYIYDITSGLGGQSETGTYCRNAGKSGGIEVQISGVITNSKIYNLVSPNGQSTAGWGGDVDEIYVSFSPSPGSSNVEIFNVTGGKGGTASCSATGCQDGDGGIVDVSMVGGYIDNLYIHDFTAGDDGDGDCDCDVSIFHCGSAKAIRTSILPNLTSLNSYWVNVKNMTIRNINANRGEASGFFYSSSPTWFPYWVSYLSPNNGQEVIPADSEINLTWYSSSDMPAVNNFNLYYGPTEDNITQSVTSVAKSTACGSTVDCSYNWNMSGVDPGTYWVKVEAVGWDTTYPNNGTDNMTSLYSILYSDIAPVMQNLTFSPDPVYTNTNLVASAYYYDENEVAGSVYFNWTVNDIQVYNSLSFEANLNLPNYTLYENNASEFVSSLGEEFRDGNFTTYTSNTGVCENIVNISEKWDVSQSDYYVAHTLNPYHILFYNSTSSQYVSLPISYFYANRGRVYNISGLKYDDGGTDYLNVSIGMQSGYRCLGAALLTSRLYESSVGTYNSSSDEGINFIDSFESGFGDWINETSGTEPDSQISVSSNWSSDGSNSIYFHGGSGGDQALLRRELNFSSYSHMKFDVNITSYGSYRGLYVFVDGEEQYYFNVTNSKFDFGGLSNNHNISFRAKGGNDWTDPTIGYLDNVQFYNKSSDGYTSSLPSGTTIYSVLNQGNYSKGDNITVYTWANDSTSTSATINLSITVTNSLPTFDFTLATQTISHSQNLSYDINCTDADSDAITYYDNTSLFDINSTSGLISDNPAIGDEGSYSVLVICGDGENTSSFFTYTITNGNPVMSAPQIYPDPLRTGTTANANSTYTDVDNDVGTVYVNWTVNNVLKKQSTFNTVSNGTVVSDSLNFANYTSGDEVEVFFWANDSIKTGSVTTDSIVVGSQPIIESNYTLPTYPKLDQSFVVQVNVSDIDNSTINWVNFTITAPNGTNMVDNVNGTYYGSFNTYSIWNSTPYTIDAQGWWNWSYLGSDGSYTFSSNGTFETEIPSVTISTPNGSYGVNYDIPLNYTTSYITGTTCLYYVVNASNQSQVFKENVSVNCISDFNHSTTFNVSYYGNMTLIFNCTDIYENVNSTLVNFTLVYDTVDPWVNVLTPTGTYNSTTIPLTASVTDDFLEDGTCWYKVTNNVAVPIIGLEHIDLDSCADVDTTFVIPSEGSYFVTLYANDSANNQGNDFNNFLYDADTGGDTPPSGGGGGGGGGTEIKITQIIEGNGTSFIGCGDGICGEGEDPYNCWEDCQINYDTMIKCIWDDDIECNWKQNWFPVAITVFLLLVVVFSYYYSLQKNKKGKKGGKSSNVFDNLFQS